MPFSPLAVNVWLARDIIAAHSILLFTAHPLLSPQLPGFFLGQRHLLDIGFFQISVAFQFQGRQRSFQVDVFLLLDKCLFCLYGIGCMRSVHVEFTMKGFCQCIQDHVYPNCSGNIFEFQLVTSIPCWACQPAQDMWPLELSWSTREQKPPSHLLTIILELARLVPVNSGGVSLFCLMFSVHLLSERCALPPTGNAPLPL